MSNTVEFKYELGARAKDKITGLKGTLTAQVKWISGCVQYSFQPYPEGGKQEAPRSYWLDEGCIELLKTKPVKIESAKEKPGGPQQGPAPR